LNDWHVANIMLTCFSQEENSDRLVRKKDILVRKKERKKERNKEKI